MLLTNTPFKIALVHQPNWGYGSRTEWDNLANSADVKLVVAGHTRNYLHTEPGDGKNFHTTVVGQDQLCKITTFEDYLTVTVINISGTEVDTFTISYQ